ncbi:unnamed protein product [Prorocentrum cordatum]|uniref:Aspartyl-tRNA synthetase n=1 Tax=Prorocentrum cordatum TaxID=2364126 RepID=A0ABN9UH86_9DINO|nr:unnamed protein product [Polarella glacialis]
MGLRASSSDLEDGACEQDLGRTLPLEEGSRGSSPGCPRQQGSGRALGPRGSSPSRPCERGPGRTQTSLPLEEFAREFGPRLQPGEGPCPGALLRLTGAVAAVRPLSGRVLFLDVGRGSEVLQVCLRAEDCGVARLRELAVVRSGLARGSPVCVVGRPGKTGGGPRDGLSIFATSICAVPAPEGGCRGHAPTVEVLADGGQLWREEGAARAAGAVPHHYAMLRLAYLGDAAASSGWQRQQPAQEAARPSRQALLERALAAACGGEAPVVQAAPTGACTRETRWPSCACPPAARWPGRAPATAREDRRWRQQSPPPGRPMPLWLRLTTRCQAAWRWSARPRPPTSALILRQSGTATSSSSPLPAAPPTRGRGPRGESRTPGRTPGSCTTASTWGSCGRRSRSRSGPTASEDRGEPRGRHEPQEHREGAAAGLHSRGRGGARPLRAPRRGGARAARLAAGGGPRVNGAGCGTCRRRLSEAHPTGEARRPVLGGGNGTDTCTPPVFPCLGLLGGPRRHRWIRISKSWAELTPGRE